ncbi:MAG: Mov34/MPN/PAD-1 family protein [Betaproteobacteria bacterium]
MSGVDRTRAISIRRAALDQVLAHARAALPDECCGLLLGTGSGIVAVHRARNLEPSPTRFLIDPSDHCAALRAARHSGVEVAGVYHSHPAGAAVPSRRDLAEASYADYLYLIVGLVEPVDVRLFALDAGNFLELTFVPVP